MSLFGSLVTGASALNAQSQSTAIIANNVANATTNGFKRSEATFHDIVADESLKSTLSNAVSVTRVQRVDQAGAIRQTSSNTDAAILGNGMFAVKQSPTAEGEFLYTRNGAFDTYASNEGGQIMRNAAGFFLYAWQLDQNGNIVGGNDLDSLVPADVSIIDELGLPTTLVSTGLNLDAEEEAIDNHVLGQLLPVTNVDSQFARNFTIYDNEGAGHELTLEFRKIVGPMAHFTSDIGTPVNRSFTLVDPAGFFPNIMAGETFQISSGGDTLTIDIVAGAADKSLNQAATIGDLLDVINDFVGSGGTNPFDAHLTGAGRLQVQANDLSASLDISGSSAGVLGTGGLNIIADPLDADYVYAPEADINGGAQYPDQSDFPAFADVTSTNTRGWWEVRVLTPPDLAITDPLNPLYGVPVEVSRGLVNFDGNGNLNSTNGIINLTNLDFDSSAAVDNLASLTIDISEVQQSAGPYTVIFTDQNGAPTGQRTGVEITRDGTIRANFSNGAKADLYRIPLVMFININGLMEVNGTAYAQTAEAGELRVLEAGIDGAGFLSPHTIEASNVDMANEFSELIVSQRAFTAGSQLMKTIDEMTQRLDQLAR